MVRLLVVALATLGLASPHLMIFHVETDGLNPTEPFPSVCRIWFTKWQKHQSCGWASLEPHRLRLDVCKWRSKMLTFASNLKVKPEGCWTLGHRKETRTSKCNSLPEGKRSHISPLLFLSVQEITVTIQAAYEEKKLILHPLDSRLVLCSLMGFVASFNPRLRAALKKISAALTDLFFPPFYFFPLGSSLKSLNVQLIQVG